MNIRQSYLNAAACASSTESTRYYLNGVLVYLKDGFVYYVATDGHVMIVLRHESDANDAPWGDVIIPNEAIRNLRAAKIKEDGIVATKENDRYFLGPIGFMPVDGTFPNWRRAVPQEVSLQPAHYNVEIAYKFIKAAKLLGSLKPLLEIFHNGDGPGLVNLNSDIDGFGLIMPFRGDMKFSAPSWATKVD